MASGGAEKAGHEDIPGFTIGWGGRGLGQFGLMSQDGLRQALHAVRKWRELLVLLGSGPIDGHCFWSEFHLDRFSLGLIRPLEIRSVPLGGIVVTGAIGFSALHRPAKCRPFAEAFQVLELALQLKATSLTALQVFGMLGSLRFVHVRTFLSLLR